ncbi:hypothetical protein [Ruixingdingia sedimenti]|uniref:Uncharacterized protein n=1 Tax=Ruixingdingia sedimenti TaxID=3073604 RepID=A0ABU1F8B3_9RHOB|nr:hypothetical protein [Xinfangfangia sp. LG-4]MDR5653111.1 hypothetical protein [Xinfangfangia sp. LG-4]
MGYATVQQMADRIAALMESRLNVGGRGLPEKLRRGGRRLPRRVRREAEYLAEVSVLAQNPRVQLMLDDARIAAAYDVCLRHLNGIGAAERFWAAVLGITGSLAFALLVVAGLVIGVLVWRGYL